MANMPLVSVILGEVIFLGLLWAAWISRKEEEPQASVRLGLVSLAVLALFLAPTFLPPELGPWLGFFLVVSVLAVGLVFILPIRGERLVVLGEPVRGVDERDIMFSRATLVPGTARFEDYYRSRPHVKALDDEFRAVPGLLSPGSAHFHREGFAAADAAFWTIELLRPFVEGGGSGWKEGGSPEPDEIGCSPADPPPTKLGGELGGDPGLLERGPRDPAEMSRFLKEWTLKMGAHSVGITQLQEHHLYTHVGRGPDYGKPVESDHGFALALTVEMDKEMVDRAPRSPTAMESALQYLQGGVMAVQVADLIRRLGYRARAHVDGNYRVICPLVAKDAGLGEFGRMGLLMTPRLGPRVRIAVVTTDLPLAVDQASPDPTVADFCVSCKKCADCCPSRAISFEDAEEDGNGVLRWTIDHEACFTLWGRLGTDCARCMAVCPYSHPDNALHSVVRWGIRENALFRRAVLSMDHLLYGRRPSPKADLEWMRFTESGATVERKESGE
ncbi:MAG: 4Fe-4S dicluster domain-containing protein [Gemmatimonadetes bacterium]|nr:4Fe-4S dicluster domain-containing protein [Gemmatimonadota bacterium]